MYGQSESVAVTDGIKLVLFDMDNVLCDYDRAKRVACLAELAGTSSAFIHEAIWDSGFELLGDSGALDAADYLRGFGERIGYPLSLDEWVEARRRSMQANAAMLEIVRRLRKTVDVAILTNNTTLVADHIDALLPDLRPLFGSKSTPRPSSIRRNRTRAAIAAACPSSTRCRRPCCSSTISWPMLPARVRRGCSRIATRRWRRSGRPSRNMACFMDEYA